VVREDVGVNLSSGGPPASGLLVAGTSSDAGKSVIVAGLCRALARRAVRVAPFKAQNMSNNAMVCADGGEIGRAQWLQAVAAGVEPTTAMNPVLLKPGTDRRAFVVVRGRPAGVLEAGEYAAGRAHLRDAAFAAYRELAAEYELVVCEGAGSPAEINLREGDYVNLGLAREFGLPVVVVGDIDRGGILASLYGTWALLDDADRALLTAFVINKFRGDVSVLEPGLDEITRRTGVPFRGVIPWLLDVWLDSEDTLAVGQWRASSASSPTARDRLRVAVVRLPRISNATDVDALAAEPGVDVLVTADSSVVEAADLVVLPGSRSTAGDLAWLRERDLAGALMARAAAGRPVLGICGGYQMLAREIRDDVEGAVGLVPGLGLLPTRIDFGAEKVLGRPTGTWRGHLVDTAYEIHHGIVHAVADGAPGPEPFLDGWRSGSVWGTMWHGAFESDGFRRAWLSDIAAQAGSDWRPAACAPGFRDRRELMLDTLADAVEAHVDLDALLAPTRAARKELA